jgi:hypothetical protein
MTSAVLLQRPGVCGLRWARLRRGPFRPPAAAADPSGGTYFPHYKRFDAGVQGATPETEPLRPYSSVLAPEPQLVVATGGDHHDGIGNMDELLAAIRADQARAAAVAAALWQQIGALCLWLADELPRLAVAASAGVAVAASAASAGAAVAAAHGRAAAAAATSGEARAAAVAVATQLAGGLAGAVGLLQPALSAPRRSAAVLAAAAGPLAGRAHRAAKAALAALPRRGAGAASGRSAFAQSALLGSVLAHIPLVRSLVDRGQPEQRANSGGSGRSAPGEWEWLRPSSGGGGGWALPEPFARTAAGAQRIVAEPVACGSAFLVVRRERGACQNEDGAQQARDTAASEAHVEPRVAHQQVALGL